MPLSEGFDHYFWNSDQQGNGSNGSNGKHRYLPGLQGRDSRRAYILDTNVLLHDPASIFRFQEHVVVVPVTVLEEIDSKKHDPGIGSNARDISQKLELMISRTDDVEGGVPIPNGKGGQLFFLAGNLNPHFPKDLPLTQKDNLILAQVLFLKERFPKREMVFVTKDRNLRIKARLLGVPAEDYRHDKINEEYLDRLFHPLRSVSLTEKEVNQVFQSQGVSANWSLPYRKKWQLRHNQGIQLLDPDGRHFGLGIRKGETLRYIDYHRIKVLGCPPKVLDHKNYSHNWEQAVCMHQALDDSIKVQIIIGKAGTGKTYIAMAAALQMVLKEKRYSSIKLVKPIVTRSRLGEDIGFLPGSMKRKLLPKMRPFVEKLRLFTTDPSKTAVDGYHQMLDSELIELINIADVRGADLSDSVVLFDEAQNANPFQMRTLGTRLGENTKLIVLGDPTQIDNIYLDQYSNALVNLYLNSLRHPQPFIAQVCLTQMVRSHTSKWFEETIGAPMTASKRGRRSNTGQDSASPGRSNGNSTWPIENSRGGDSAPEVP